MNGSRSLIMVLCTFLLALLLCGFPAGNVYGQAAIQSFSSRPFVTGITPVIGSNGAVGGVTVDAAGVVARAQTEAAGNLRDIRQQAIEKDVPDQLPLRMVSLASLDRAVAKRIERNEQPTEEMYFLAGLQRVQYVFVVPERNDVVIAGPAGAVGLGAIRLDDLIDGLRYARRDDATAITCSIEPTEEGLKRYARLKSQRLAFSKRVVSAMERAMGSQQIILGGIAADSHFARVLVAADYVMKRLAMGFEPSPVDGMPNYLQLLKKNPGPAQVTSPRWWMAVNYEPLLRSSDRLAWQIRGQGVKTLTEDSILNDRGERTNVADPNHLAEQWAAMMTTKYNQLAAEVPVFTQLRDCIDLAVLGALIANEGMLTVADCKLSVLLDESRLQGPRFPIPKSLPSQATMVKGHHGWIISVSGGVEIDPWSVVQRVETAPELTMLHSKLTGSQVADRWWW